MSPTFWIKLKVRSPQSETHLLIIPRKHSGESMVIRPVLITVSTVKGLTQEDASMSEQPHRVRF